MTGPWERNDESIDLGEGNVIASTDKALRVQLESGDKPWVPRSQIHDDSELYSEEAPHNTGHLVVRAWWAEKAGLA